MALQVYDRAFLYLRGKLALEAESVEIEFMGDPLPVATIAKNFGGVTPTPTSAKINVSEFVPVQGGNVKDAIKAFLKTEKVQVAVQLGGSGEIIKTEGYFTAPKISSGAADHTKATYSILCEAKPFQ
jgi:hypothetical protein